MIVNRGFSWGIRIRPIKPIPRITTESSPLANPSIRRPSTGQAVWSFDRVRAGASVARNTLIHDHQPSPLRPAGA
jgi:hypothetical protein